MTSAFELSESESEVEDEVEDEAGAGSVKSIISGIPTGACLQQRKLSKKFWSKRLANEVCLMHSLNTATMQFGAWQNVIAIPA